MELWVRRIGWVSGIGVLGVRVWESEEGGGGFWEERENRTRGWWRTVARAAEIGRRKGW